MRNTSEPSKPNESADRPPLADDEPQPLMERLAQDVPELYSKVQSGQMDAGAAAVLAGIEVARKAVSAGDAQGKPSMPAADPEVNQSLVDIARVVYSVADPGTRNRLKEMFESVDVM